MGVLNFKIDFRFLCKDTVAVGLYASVNRSTHSFAALVYVYSFLFYLTFPKVLSERF